MSHGRWVRWARAFVVVIVACFGLVATLSVGADELPPPPGWSQEDWDTLSSEDRQIEREYSAAPIAAEDLPGVIAAKEAWSAAHGSDEQIADELLAEFLAEGPVHPDEGRVIGGIQAPQQVFGRELWSFNQRWIGVNANETLATHVYAGGRADDPSVGVLLVREVDLTQGDGSIIQFERELVYPGHGGNFQIESESGGMLTLSRWIGDVRQPGTVRFNLEARTFTSTVYPHGVGATANPPTLILDDAAPTGSTTRFKDSSAISFAGGNPWRDIGVWNAAPAAGPSSVTGLGELLAWLGLKNSDDKGTQFDVRAEIYVNDTPHATGTALCITGLTRNASLAKEASIPFGSFPAFALASSDVLKLKISTRIGTNLDGSKCSGPGGSHSNATGLRLYFDSVSRSARFNATTSP